MKTTLTFLIVGSLALSQRQREQVGLFAGPRSYFLDLRLAFRPWEGRLA